MDKEDFFIKKGETVELDIFDQKFVLRKITANDELNWMDEYNEKVVEKDEETGEERLVAKQNVAKLAKCKLRNIIEVPFSKEELKEITGLDKDFKDYADSEKDALFGQLNPKIMSKLIAEVDKTKGNQKKKLSKL